MTFLQALEPPFKRIYINFDGVPNGSLPAGWTSVVAIGTAGPEVFSNYIRASPTNSNNTNSQSYAGYVADSVNTDDQALQATTRTALNGLLCGVCIKMDAAMQNGVIGLTSTGNGRGLYTVTNGLFTKRATFNVSHAIGDVWAIKSEGNVYTMMKNPSFNNVGGDVTTWTDTTGVVKHGPNYRHGALFANSDRNAIGTRNVAAGLDNFDFRDLGWTV